MSEGVPHCQEIFPGSFFTAGEMDRQPRGVIRILSARMASGIPGASRSTTAKVASGVTSRGEKPVPPVVRTSCTFRLSAQSVSAAWTGSSPSGMIAV